MRILQVEADSLTAHARELSLRNEGLKVFTTDLGEDAVNLIHREDYDAVTLAADLPDMSGLEVLRAVRRAGDRAPILFLSGSAALDETTRAFGLGADDVLARPFHLDELTCRLRALVRRSKGHPTSTITTGQITLDLDRRDVVVVGRSIHLTGKEYQMLELLSLRKTQTVTKEAFLNHLYGGMDEPDLKIIDVFICKLRRKLSTATCGAHHIETVWGRGYRLVDDPRTTTPRVVMDNTGRPHSSESKIAKILTRLKDHGPTTFAQLMQFVGRNELQTRGYLSTLTKTRRVANDGDRYHALYRITPKGEAHLLKVGALT